MLFSNQLQKCCSANHGYCYYRDIKKHDLWLAELQFCNWLLNSNWLQSFMLHPPDLDKWCILFAAHQVAKLNFKMLHSMLLLTIHVHKHVWTCLNFQCTELLDNPSTRLQYTISTPKHTWICSSKKKKKKKSILALIVNWDLNYKYGMSTAFSNPKFISIT